LEQLEDRGEQGQRAGCLVVDQVPGDRRLVVVEFRGVHGRGPQRAGHRQRLGAQQLEELAAEDSARELAAHAEDFTSVRGAHLPVHEDRRRAARHLAGSNLLQGLYSGRRSALGGESSAPGGKFGVPLSGLLVDDDLEESQQHILGGQHTLARLDEPAGELALAVLDLRDTCGREPDQLGERHDRQSGAKTERPELGAEAGCRRAAWIKLVGRASPGERCLTTWDGVRLHCSPPAEMFAVGRSTREQRLLSLADREVRLGGSYVASTWLIPLASRGIGVFREAGVLAT